MATYRPIQNRFNVGEWSPDMEGRTDLEKHRGASRKVQNFRLLPQGPMRRRSGTRFVRELPDSTKQGRLIEFIPDELSSYALEWTELKLRIYKDESIMVGVPIPDSPNSLTVDVDTDEWSSLNHGYQDGAGPFQLTSSGTLAGGTSSSEEYFIQVAPSLPFDETDVDPTNDRLTLTAHGLTTGMGPFRITKTDGGMAVGLHFDTDYYVIVVDVNTVELLLTPNGEKVDITSIALLLDATLEPSREYAATSFRLASSDGSVVVISSAGSGSHTLTPITSVVIEIDSPYTEAQLDSIRFDQKDDVMYLTHPDVPQQKLSRHGLTRFRLDPVTYADGPYLDENAQDIEISLLAATGLSVKATATRPIFNPTDVGRHLRFKDGTPGLHWGYATIVSVSGLVLVNESRTFNGANVIVGTDTIDFGTAHGFETGMLVRLLDAGGGLPAPLLVDTNYWVRDTGANTVRLYLSLADASADTNQIDLTTIGGNGNRISSAWIIDSALAWTGGEGPYRVRPLPRGSAFLGGLVEDRDYWVVVPQTGFIALATGPNGTIVPIDDALSGATFMEMIPPAGSTAGVPEALINIETEMSGITAAPSWRMSAFSGGGDAATGVRSLGYPRAVTFYESRLWLGGNSGAPQTVYASKTDDFQVYSPTGDLTSVKEDLDDTVSDNNAIKSTIAGRQANAILWLEDSGALIAGTARRTWVISPTVTNESLKPGGIRFGRAGRVGASAIQPVPDGERILYISDSTRGVLSVGYSLESDAYAAEELSYFWRHLTKGGIRGVATATDPHPEHWCWTQSGELFSVLRDRSQDVLGAATHTIGGTSPVVESVAVIPSPAGDPSSVGRTNQNHSQVWFIVKRTIDGATKRYVEFLEDDFDEDTLDDAFFVDSGFTYNGSPTASVTGITHLAGETVDVLADGVILSDQVVSAAGVITLPNNASLVHVGYRFISDWASLRIALATTSGTTEANLKRIDHLALRLRETLGGSFGPAFDDLEELGDDLIPHDLLMDTLPPTFTGDIELAFDGGWEDYAAMVVRQSLPLPMEILAVLAKAQIGQRGNRSR